MQWIFHPDVLKASIPPYWQAFFEKLKERALLYLPHEKFQIVPKALKKFAGILTVPESTPASNFIFLLPSGCPPPTEVKKNTPYFLTFRESATPDTFVDYSFPCLYPYLPDERIIPFYKQSHSIFLPPIPPELPALKKVKNGKFFFIFDETLLPQDSVLKKMVPVLKKSHWFECVEKKLVERMGIQTLLKHLASAKKIVSCLHDPAFNQWLGQMGEILNAPLVLWQDDGASPLRYLCQKTLHPLLSPHIQPTVNLYTYGHFVQKIRQFLNELKAPIPLLPSHEKVSHIDFQTTLLYVENCLKKSAGTVDTLSLTRKSYLSPSVFGRRLRWAMLPKPTFPFPLDIWAHSRQGFSTLLTYLDKQINCESTSLTTTWRLAITYLFGYLPSNAWNKAFDYFSSGEHLQAFLSSAQTAILYLTGRSQHRDIVFDWVKAGYHSLLKKQQCDIAQPCILQHLTLLSQTEHDYLTRQPALSLCFIFALKQRHAEIEAHVQDQYEKYPEAKGLGAKISLALLAPYEFQLLNPHQPNELSPQTQKILSTALRLLELDRIQSAENYALSFYLKPLLLRQLNQETEARSHCLQAFDGLQTNGKASMLALQGLFFGKPWIPIVEHLLKRETTASLSMCYEALHARALSFLMLNQFTLALEAIQLLYHFQPNYFQNARLNLNKWRIQASIEACFGNKRRQRICQILDQLFGNNPTRMEAWPKLPSIPHLPAKTWPLFSLKLNHNNASNAGE